MPSYNIDSVNQFMTCTGIVERLMQWEETAEGKRRPSATLQARDEDTGMPLWGVEVLYVQTSFGRSSTCTAKVQVQAVEEPRLAPLTPIIFDKLRVEVRTNKAGGFVEYWSAEGIAQAEAPKETPKDAANASNGSKPASERAA